MALESSFWLVMALNVNLATRVLIVLWQNHSVLLSIRHKDHRVWRSKGKALQGFIQTGYSHSIF